MMRLLLLFILIFTFNCKVSAQTLSGKVYDTKSVVKDMKVLNKSQNRLTVTNQDGDFSIEAKVNDTISFQSIFYHPLEVILKQSHFDDITVFEVKEIVSELDEVEIQSEPEQPVFEEETYNQDLNNLIKEDMKRNPHLYRPESTQYGANIFGIISLVVKLLKKKNKDKNKYKPPTYNPITYKQMDSLFTNSSFFNKQLATENLKIPKDKVKLFYDFCSAKGISSKLLLEENKMILLEELVVNSQLFLILLEEYGEQATVKD